MNMSEELHMKATAFISIFVISITVAFVSAEARSSKDLNSSLDQVCSFLQNRQITRIEILHVSDNLETRTRITPERLRTMSKTKVVIDNPWESSSFKDLQSSLQELKDAKSRETGEVRWALILSDASGKEMSAIYLSSDGSLGIFHEASLTLHGRLLTWAKGFIKTAFLTSLSG
jgi:hypothetical protein